MDMLIMLIIWTANMFVPKMYLDFFSIPVKPYTSTHSFIRSIVAAPVLMIIRLYIALPWLLD